MIVGDSNRVVLIFFDPDSDTDPDPDLPDPEPQILNPRSFPRPSPLVPRPSTPAPRPSPLDCEKEGA